MEGLLILVLAWVSSYFDLGYVFFVRDTIEVMCLCLTYHVRKYLMSIHPSISYVGIGLLVWLLSLPQNYSFSLSQLQVISGKIFCDYVNVLSLNVF